MEEYRKCSDSGMVYDAPPRNRKGRMFWRSWSASGSVVKIQDRPTRRQLIAGVVSSASEAKYATWWTQDEYGPPKAIIARIFRC